MGTAFSDPISFDSASRHAAPVRDARLPSDSGLKQDSCAVLGFSPSLRSIRAAHNGLALGKETVSDRQRKALSGPSVRSSMARRIKSGYSLPHAPLPLMPTKAALSAVHGRAPGWDGLSAAGVSCGPGTLPRPPGERQRKIVASSVGLPQRRKEDDA